MSNNPTLQEKIQNEIAALAESITDAVEKFKQLQHPLTESSEHVPKATHQLDKITQQTEAATHQMLDLIEGIVQREESLKKGLGETINEIAEGKTQEASTRLEGLTEMADTTCNDAYTIMDALQFQDITAQQVNHAAALLDALDTKLKHALRVMAGGGAGDDEAEETASAPERAYDPHADLFEKRTEQDEIDNLFSQKK